MVGVVTLPETLLKNVKNRILPQWKACFWAAIIVGLLTHFYKITNWLPNWDSLVFRYDSQNMLSMGRWFLPVVSAVSSFYDLPWVAGLMAIVFHALGALCICKMLGIQKKATAIFVGAAVAAFPTVTSVMMYNYVADAYALSFLLACAAALLLTAEKPKILPSLLCIALSVGIYQAYITVTVTLLLTWLIVKTMQNETTVKEILLKSGTFLLTGALGMALYYLVLTVLLKITGTALLSYQGFDSAASLSGIDIFGALYTIRESFLSYFFDFTEGVSFFGILNAVIFLLTLAFYLTDVIRKKLGVAKFLVLCVLVVLLPIGASILSFVNSGVDYHNLMKMGFIAFYLLFFLQYENGSAWKLWTIFLLTTLLVFYYGLVANISYHKLNLSYEKSYGTLLRVADRLEQTEGAANCDRILVLGALADSEAYSSNLPPDMTGTTDGYILRADDEMVGQSVFCSALNDYCGKDYTFLAGAEKAALLETVDADKMGIWPEKDSICVQDNVIVLKLGEVD